MNSFQPLLFQNDLGINPEPFIKLTNMMDDPVLVDRLIDNLSHELLHPNEGIEYLLKQISEYCAIPDFLSESYHRSTIKVWGKKKIEPESHYMLRLEMIKPQEVEELSGGKYKAFINLLENLNTTNRQYEKDIIMLYAAIQATQINLTSQEAINHILEKHKDRLPATNQEVEQALENIEQLILEEGKWIDTEYEEKQNFDTGEKYKIKKYVFEFADGFRVVAVDGGMPKAILQTFRNPEKGLVIGKLELKPTKFDTRGKQKIWKEVRQKSGVSDLPNHIVTGQKVEAGVWLLDVTHTLNDDDNFERVTIKDTFLLRTLEDPNLGQRQSDGSIKFLKRPYCGRIMTEVLRRSPQKLHVRQLPLNLEA